jgi:apolipoprotein D and lipocalin family protein
MIGRRRGVLGVVGVVLALVCAACVQTVPKVNVQRYLGHWYQPLGYPQPFTAGLVGITADYALNQDGTLSVHNRGYRGSCSGPVSDIVGTATVTNPPSNSKLTVVFPSVPITQYFKGLYWIIGLDKHYRWAVVSDPYKVSLFVLSRTPTLPPSSRTAVNKVLRQQGYDLSRVRSFATCA